MNSKILFDAETETQVEEQVDVLEALIEDKNLIIFNDDYNTFDHVINTLIKVCKHEAVQAEQCTHIIHYKGKCAVKAGHYEQLEPMCSAILERGINAEIQ